MTVTVNGTSDSDCESGPGSNHDRRSCAPSTRAAAPSVLTARFRAGGPHCDRPESAGRARTKPRPAAPSVRLRARNCEKKTRPPSPSLKFTLSHAPATRRFAPSLRGSLRAGARAGSLRREEQADGLEAMRTGRGPGPGPRGPERRPRDSETRGFAPSSESPRPVRQPALAPAGERASRRISESIPAARRYTRICPNEERSMFSSRAQGPGPAGRSRPGRPV